jgi:hypothetical protein
MKAGKRKRVLVSYRQQKTFVCLHVCHQHIQQLLTVSKTRKFGVKAFKCKDIDVEFNIVFVQTLFKHFLRV